MVEINIDIEKVREHILAAGGAPPSIEECHATLQLVGFEYLGDRWRCARTLLAALDQSEFQLIEHDSSISN